ncbi:MAG TPA: hypothetical protein VGI64_15105 [Streptosporangiaceae bacterium]
MSAASDEPVLTESGGIFPAPALPRGRVAPPRDPAGRYDLASGSRPPGGPSTPAGRADMPAPSAGEVLADRLASALVHHEPGWRLPRHSALARRYNVSTAQIDAALDELTARHLIRRLADGQLYRASPAEYLISLNGMPGLTSHVDPMGGELSCRSRQVSWRRVPEDIGWALGVGSADLVYVARFLWTAGGEPAAFSTTYLPGREPDPTNGEAGTPKPVGVLPLTGFPDAADTMLAEVLPATQPGALHVELQPPPPSVARSLRLSAGQPAMMVTLRFDDPQASRPVALTVAVLRPDMFRVVIQSAQQPLPDGEDGQLSGTWTHAVEDWES